MNSLSTIQESIPPDQAYHVLQMRDVLAGLPYLYMYIYIYQRLAQIFI